MKIVPLEDLEDARELHKLAFPADHYPDPACESWAMVDDTGAMIGYCAAKLDPLGELYIARVAAAGKNVATRLVRHAMRWGKREGANIVSTYILLKNYTSIFLFRKLGFTFFVPDPAMQYVGPEVHYLWRKL